MNLVVYIYVISTLVYPILFGGWKESNEYYSTRPKSNRRFCTYKYAYFGIPRTLRSRSYPPTVTHIKHTRLIRKHASWNKLRQTENWRVDDRWWRRGWFWRAAGSRRCRWWLLAKNKNDDGERKNVIRWRCAIAEKEHWAFVDEHKAAGDTDYSSPYFE